MGETAHHHLVFETTIGFCGIAWNEVGVTRFRFADKKRRSGQTNSAAPYVRCGIRRAHAGGGPGNRGCEAVFRGQGDGFFRLQARPQ